MNEPKANFSISPKLHELLHSYGSMTSQLEALGQEFSVSLIHEAQEGAYFRRYTYLNLNHKPVILACSSCLVQDVFFTQLLMHAKTIPIGKFLFASESAIQRLPNMQIHKLPLAAIFPPQLQLILKNSQLFEPPQSVWQRHSRFSYQTEQLEVIEILLPALEKFY